MTRVDGRLEALDDKVGVLRDDVAALKDDVAVLNGDVQKLRVLYEAYSDRIQTIAEVQDHHGRQLAEHGKLLVDIRAKLTPLDALYNFVRRVADDHEKRLTVLEKHTGIESDLNTN